MRLFRNFSFLILLVAVLLYGAATPASAYGYCDFYGGVNPAYYGGIESPVSCGVAENICDGFLNGNLCRDFCNEFCFTSQNWSPVSCLLDNSWGGGQCTFDAVCICDLDAGSR